MRGQGVLLLYHFALHKLLQSRTLARLVRGLVPRRMDGRGRRVRDRGAQVRMLVEGDAGFRARYLAVLKALHGLVLRQLAAIARALDVQPLLLSDAEGRLDGRPYLRLLSSFLHEALYSGLSVIVGFEYRTAAAAFQEGAEKVLAGTPGRR
jgi:hypothetical protein